MDGMESILALGGSAGAAGATFFVVVRALVQAWQTHQTETTRRKVTDARRDESLIPDMQDDFARQRKELWDEIRRLRSDVDKLTLKLDDALKREREARSEVERLRVEIGRVRTASYPPAVPVRGREPEPPHTDDGDPLPSRRSG